MAANLYVSWCLQSRDQLAWKIYKWEGDWQVQEVVKAARAHLALAALLRRAAAEISMLSPAKVLASSSTTTLGCCNVGSRRFSCAKVGVPCIVAHAAIAAAIHTVQLHKARER